MVTATRAVGSAALQGDLWSQRSHDWAEVQEATAQTLYEAALDRLDIGPDIRLLDVGCGSGMFCEWARAREAVVTGIDAARALVEIARRRVPFGRFDVGEMEALPYNRGSFDVVTGFNAFQYTANPLQALAEAARVVERRGSVAVATWGRVDDCEARVYLAAVGSLLPPPPKDTPGPFALSGEAALRGLAVAAGLRPGDIYEVEMPFAYPDLETALRGMLSAGPAARAINTVGEERVREAVAAAIAPYRTPSGGYRLNNRFRLLLATKA